MARTDFDLFPWLFACVRVRNPECLLAFCLFSIAEDFALSGLKLVPFQFLGFFRADARSRPIIPRASAGLPHVLLPITSLFLFTSYL